MRLVERIGTKGQDFLYSSCKIGSSIFAMVLPSVVQSGLTDSAFVFGPLNLARRDHHQWTAIGWEGDL